MTETMEDYQLGDVKELERLFTTHDPRGLEQMIAEDVEYEDTTVKEVTVDGRHATILREDGWTMGVTIPEGNEPPEPGDSLRVYGRGIGFPFYGYAVNGDVWKWETPFERFSARIKMLAAHDRSRREHLDKARPDLDRWYAELSGPFKARIDRMREQPGFEVEHGSYETYPVLMAQRIAAWVDENQMVDEAQKATVERFRDMVHDEQAQVLHGGEGDKYGISGHQFDAACGLALAALEGKEI
jgi:hypothetical protein